jgi:hypothetical protein
MKKAPWLIVCVLVLAGCAGNVQWRASSANPPPPRTASTSEEVSYLDYEHYQTTLLGEPGLKSHNRGVLRPHSISYIEFDDQGDFLDRNQLVDAISHIPDGPNRLVVFYAHGWQNNTRSADVGQFNALLAHLAHTLNEPTQKRDGGLLISIPLSGHPSKPRSRTF